MKGFSTLELLPGRHKTQEAKGTGRERVQRRHNEEHNHHPPRAALPRNGQEPFRHALRYCHGRAVVTPAGRIAPRAAEDASEERGLTII